MCSGNRFEERYKNGDTPWDHSTPDRNLIDAVEQAPIAKCKALDVGCGTGDNAIWLAQQRFTVTGCDLSRTAIKKAKRKAAEFKVSCTFFVADFLEEKILGLPFGFVFDRGCLHTFKTDEERKRFSEKVALHLKEGGLWLTISGNADDKDRDTGPPKLTAMELAAAVETNFEIISLAASRFSSAQSDRARAWVCLMRKRKCSTF